MASLKEVGRARPESLVAFLPLVLDKLLLLMVKPPTVAGLTLNVGQVQQAQQAFPMATLLAGCIFCNGSCCESSFVPPQPQERQPWKKRLANDLYRIPGEQLKYSLF